MKGNAKSAGKWTMDAWNMQNNSFFDYKCVANISKASQPRGWASGSHAYGRHEMQGVIFKSTRHECSVFVNLWPLLLHIHSRHQFFSPRSLISFTGKVYTSTSERMCESFKRCNKSLSSMIE